MDSMLFGWIGMLVIMLLGFWLMTYAAVAVALLLGRIALGEQAGPGIVMAYALLSGGVIGLSSATSSAAAYAREHAPLLGAGLTLLLVATTLVAILFAGRKYLTGRVVALATGLSFAGCMIALLLFA